MSSIGTDDLVRDLRSMADQLEIDVDGVAVTPDTSFEDLGMDSLNLIDFLVFLERRYHVKIADRDLNAVETVGEVLAVLNDAAVVR
jgi:acyl carrier protein